MPYNACLELYGCLGVVELLEVGNVPMSDILEGQDDFPKII